MNDTVITIEDKRRKFLSDLKSLSYWNKRIIEVNLKLEEIGVRLYEAGSVNYQRIPTTAHVNKVELMLKEESLLKQRSQYVSHFTECEIILRELSIEVQEYLIYSFIVPGKMKTQEQIAKQYLLSRSALFDLVTRSLTVALLNI